MRKRNLKKANIKVKVNFGKRIFIVILVFALLVSLIFNLFFLVNYNKVYALDKTRIFNFLEEDDSKPTSDSFSLTPKYHIYKDQIKVFNNSVIISAKNVQWSIVENTSSMLPLLRYNSFILEKPVRFSEIKPGDIITFYYPECNCKVVHRVIKVGYDSKGWFAITKGDHNNYNDGKIRKDQLIGIVFGILY